VSTYTPRKLDQVRTPNGLAALVLIVAVFLGRVGPTNAADLESQVLNQIQAATFEVVAAKPVADNLTYIKPLPLELLPFQERNDKYYSIGTAFLIGNNRFVTAAHVLDTGIGSLWGTPALRDSNGHVFPVDKIEKFSLARDFAVFSVVGHPDATSLKLDTQPKPNGVVYAVGNALGTGVVVRDGVFTSKTPEEQDGRWNWLRFSAAASPGNSGGPLLDKDGAVIGIVLRRSQNENLNYALPIEEVIKAPDHQAHIDNRFSYQLEVLDTAQRGTFKNQFSLPLSFGEFSATFLKLANAFSDSQLKALLGKEPDRVFPNGPGSARLLHNLPRMQYFPALITRHGDGEWAISDKKGARTALSANGYVISGNFGRDLLFRMRRPDDVSGAVLADAELFMKQLLTVGFMRRAVGTERVQVTGVGKPIEDSMHVDGWKRRWQVRVWPLPFANEMFVTLSLPVPDGYVTIARYSLATDWHENLIDLEATTDFVSVGYWGTFAQWKEFLANAALSPDALKAVAVDYEYGRRFSFESKRASFSFTQELQGIGPKSLMGLGFNYLNGDGKPQWDVGAVRVQQDDEDYGHWMAIERQVAPSDGLDDSYKTYWGKVVHRQHPFDAVARTDNDVTKITTVIDTPNANPPSVLYSAFVGAAGSNTQDAMKGKLDSLLRNLRITEH